MTLSGVRRGGIAEIGRRTGKHPTTIRRWIKDGKFPQPVWIGSRRAWDLAEVEAWIAAQQRPEKFNLPGR